MSQPRWRGISLEGGGILGIGHLGAIQALSEVQSLMAFSHLSGSSAGSLVAAALACRASLDKIRNILDTMPTDLLDEGCCSLYSLFCKFGIFKGQTLKSWIGEIVESLTGDRQITLAGIQARYNSFLIITATRLLVPYSEVVYYSPETEPGMLLTEALYRSCCIPIVYQADYDGVDYWVDGGLIDNLPIRILSKYLEPSQIVGVRLLSSAQLSAYVDWRQQQAAPPVQRAFGHPPKNLNEVITTIIGTLRDQLSRLQQTGWPANQTIWVDIGKLSSLSFDLKPEDKADLIASGYKAAKAWMAN